MKVYFADSFRVVLKYFSCDICEERSVSGNLELSIACECSRGNWPRDPRLARTFFTRGNAGPEMNSADIFSAESLPCGYGARCDVLRCNV